MSKKLNKLRRIAVSILAALLGAVFMVLLYYSQLAAPIANIVNDALYQRPQPPHPDIIIVGMDEAALNEYGPTPWPRSIVADAVTQLNSDPENRPAVIGLDILFVGESEPENPSDPASVAAAAANDQYLADAVGQYGNVVVATSATFGSQLVVEEDGSFYTDDYAIQIYEEPYEALRENTSQGHVNAMIDEDGILRHAIWQIELPNGELVPSFNQEIYRMYMQYQGQPADVVPPMDAQYRWYVSFQSQPFGFDDGFSITSLINGELDPAIFADKIVLIGPFAQGMFDEYTTAIDHAVKMYGVEYQANALAALLNNDLKTEVLPLPQYILLFVFMLLSLFWFYNRRLLPATLMWLGTSLGWVLICYAMWQLGYVLQVAYLPFGATVGYMYSIASNYASAALEKRRVERAFKRYVAPQVVSELLNGDPKALQLGGRLVDIAVLFVDIRGFTTMSEKLPAPVVVEIVNRYLTLTSRCVFDNHGTLDKYVGDCTMAFWGAPIAQKDVAYKAVKAALDMMQGAQELGEQLQRDYGHYVEFGIGINYGPAVVGNIGSNARMDYTAIGDTVNTAARLESNAPPGCIYISAEVAAALEGRARLTALGNSIKLKGKSEAFEIFKVEELL